MIDRATRELVRQRAEDRCEYCRLPQEAASYVTFHVEDIRAKQHGGSDVFDNLSLACPDCNAAKGPNLTAIDPESDEIVALFNPRVDEWPQHFCYAGVQITGRTKTGRATVSLLRFNDPERTRMREELLMRGEM